MMKDERFIWFVIACTVAMTGLLPRYFLICSSAESKGIDSTYPSWLLSLMNGCSIIGRVGIGYLSDRLGKSTALALSFLLCGLGHFIFWVPGATLPQDEVGAATTLFSLFVVCVGALGSGFISLFPVVIANRFGSADGVEDWPAEYCGGAEHIGRSECAICDSWLWFATKVTTGVSTAGASMIAGGLLLARCGHVEQEQTEGEGAASLNSVNVWRIADIGLVHPIAGGGLRSTCSHCDQLYSSTTSP